MEPIYKGSEEWYYIPITSLSLVELSKYNIKIEITMIQ